ncbi:MAG TPA: hypothetical protein VL856_20285, partial [Acidimicrobiia bacterium]|nr:hypothetical protein [Acidimicrobiia bacterium]
SADALTPEVAEDEAPPTVGPPVPLLVLAVCSVLLSAALLLLDGLPAHVTGYILGSFVTIVLVGLFHRTDLQRRKQPFYLGRPALSRYAGLIAAVGVILSAFHIWSIATVLAK